ncbi:MAG: hypothetical protein R3A13_09795 [Bdellovibrionota bacterium]
MITQAKNLALEYAAQARETLLEIKRLRPEIETSAYQDLDTLIDFVVERMG